MLNVWQVLFSTTTASNPHYHAVYMCVQRASENVQAGRQVSRQTPIWLPEQESDSLAN